MVEMDQVTQQTPRSSRQTAPPAHSLKDQIDVLREAIESFSLPA